MSEYDGEVQLSVSLKPGDIKASAQKLSESVSNIFDANAGKTLDKSLQRILTSMDKVNNKAQSLQAQMKTLETTKVPTAEYQSIIKDIDTISNKMDMVNQKMKAFESSGNTAAKGYIKLRDEMSKLEKIEDGLLQKSFDLEDSGKAYTEGVNTDKYSKLSIDLAQLNNQQRVNISTYNEAERKLNDVANSTKKVSTQTKAASKNTKTFGTSMKSASKNASGFNINLGKIFKKILMYGFGIRSVYLLVRKVRQAIAEGLNEMAKMNGGANATNKALSALTSSFSAFKNSIAAAVAPLVNLLAPALARIIDLFTATMNRVASFIALLTGASTYMKAIKIQKDFAAGLDKTGKAAKKANKELQQLAGFDELNLLSKKDEDDSGGSGGGAGAGFEEVPIDPKILDWANKLKDIWSKIWDYIKKLGEAFKSGFWEAMGDWQSKVADIKKNLGIIWDALKEIATDPDVVAAADRWAQSFAHMLGTTAGMFASIGLTIAQNLIGGMAKFLASNKEDIKQYLIDMFDIRTVINDQIAAFEVAVARIFDVFGQENGQQLTANILGIFWELFSNIRLLAAKLGRDILILVTQPIIDNVDGFKQAFDGILGVLASLAGSIKYTLNSAFGHFNDMYDAHIKPFFNNLTSALSHLVGVLLEMWNTYIKPVLDDWGLRINNLLTEHIRPAINTAIDLIGSIVNLLTTVLGPIVLKLQVMIQGAIAILVPIVQNMGRVFIEVVGMMADWIGNFLTIFKDAIDVIVALLNGDWASAWESAQKLFEDVWTAIKDFFKSNVNTIISIAEGLINTVIGIVNTACDMITKALGGLSFDVPDWVPEIGGKSFDLSLTIPKVSQVHFPRLAKGAVIPPNKEFMAVLGDQKNGTNIETPLDTMIEAFNVAKGDEESLLREQNSILRQLLEKEWNIGTKDIFDAARKENVNFINKTGRSAFAY